MTKLQNTKNEQLTEQFNHGLLPDGWYYYKASDGRSDIATEYGLFCIEADNKVKIEVLAEVPSYSEYLALQSDSLAKNEAVEINAELEAENAKLREEYEAECHRSDELEDSLHIAWKDINKLKELLKECVIYVNHRFIGTRETLTKPYTASDKVLHKKAEKLLTKIDEALK